MKNLSEEELAELLGNHGEAYLAERSDYSVHPMDELSEIVSDSYEAVRMAFYGGRFGDSASPFNPNDDYFTFSVGSGNLESIPYIEDFMAEVIDMDDFVEWCEESGYLDD